MSGLSARPRIGSFLPKSARKGRSHLPSASHALRFAGTAGSLGPVGTSAGKMRAPALYAALGNGASYARRTSFEGFVTQPEATIRPMGKRGDQRANARQALNAGGTERSAVGRKPLPMTIRAKRSWFS